MERDPAFGLPVEWMGNDQNPGVRLPDFRCLTAPAPVQVDQTSRMTAPHRHEQTRRTAIRPGRSPKTLSLAKRVTDYEAETSGALVSSWGETRGGQSDELRIGRNGAAS
jgi:hypothetical protein